MFTLFCFFFHLILFCLLWVSLDNFYNFFLSVLLIISSVVLSCHSAHWIHLCYHVTNIFNLLFFGFHFPAEILYLLIHNVHCYQKLLWCLWWVVHNRNLKISRCGHLWWTLGPLLTVLRNRTISCAILQRLKALALYEQWVWGNVQIYVCLGWQSPLDSCTSAYLPVLLCCSQEHPENTHEGLPHTYNFQL